MTTFLLLHGSGDAGWAWQLVCRALQQRGHEAVAPDLPTDRDGVTWDDCVHTVIASCPEADVVVGHSAGGFVVPLVADRIGARLQVYVAGMVPAPGETPMAWFEHLDWSTAVKEQAAADGGLTGSEDVVVTYFHDVDAGLAERAVAHERPTSDALGEMPWPREDLPAVPAAYVVTTADRFLPPVVQRRAAARLSLDHPEELASGHCPNLSRPHELAALLVELSRDSSRAGG